MINADRYFVRVRLPDGVEEREENKMSIRANIIIKDRYTKLYFYRHSDGYPEVTRESLNVFMNWLKDGKIRDNVNQAAGWLIILGNDEYEVGNEPKGVDGFNWKVGAYEPTTGLHGDIDYLYVIDLEKETLEIFDSDFHEHDK
jgi:hypothetical protein